MESINPEEHIFIEMCMICGRWRTDVIIFCEPCADLEVQWAVMLKIDISNRNLLEH
jgi:hypothetical protein